MARVTVQDCIDVVPNRFELVLLAAQRTRQLSSGSLPTVDRGNDKFPVVALREIAGENVPIDQLHEGLIVALQQYVKGDEPEAELMELLAEEQAIAGQDVIEAELEAELEIDFQAEMAKDESEIA